MFKEVYVRPDEEIDEKMSMILQAFQLSGLKILMPTPYLSPLSTSQPLRLVDTQ
ncbi:hypothetical protein D8674_034092 [Pyrus ussuriensis x Pyrus communis]|uniref:Uncharacterized protein n=1 Tax=Pyrus ussuriensis x Pyrus communis TaxID=2448454 RepID=A0A5N5HR25_9ROSA|nr:hypothetical protein D8674_034092 [Pyrus ussuriensis x Pyrus communis]